MGAAVTPPTRRGAFTILTRGRAGTEELIAQIPTSKLTTSGLGGGEWSVKDLLGHLASWEAFALDALAAWEAGERAPIDDLQFTISTSRINRGNVERKAAWSLAKVRRESERTHRELLEALGGVSDARWRRPVSPRGRKPLGVRLGGILGGPAGPFRHDEAHHPSVRSFLADLEG